MHIGISEIIVIGILFIALVRPNELPAYSKKLGSAIATLKQYASKFSEVSEPVKETVDSIKGVKQDIDEQISDIKNEIISDKEDLK